MASVTRDDMTTIQERITAFWNAVAGDYDADPGNVAAPGTPAYAAWAQAIRSVLPNAPSDVLDLGTGTGYVASIVAELGHRVTGLDLSEKMLAVARAKALDARLEVSFETGDAVAPPLPAASFDVVIARSLIWTLRELQTAFCAWHALLRSGGRVVVIYSLSSDEAHDDDAAAPSEDGRRDFFMRYYTTETQAALPGIKLRDHQPLLRASQLAGFVDASVTPLETVRRCDTASAPDEPYALVARRT